MFRSSTREPYIWVPAPDDVKTGVDPKPVAQRVPQRGRLSVVFPSCASVTSSCRVGASGSHLRRPRAPSMEDLAQQIPISLTGQVGDGGWEGSEGSSDPQHAPLTALKFTFHTASCAAGEPPSVILRTELAVRVKAICQTGTRAQLSVRLSLLDRSLQCLFQIGEDRERPAETGLLLLCSHDLSEVTKHGCEEVF